MNTKVRSPILVTIALVVVFLIIAVAFGIFGKERRVVTPECTPDVRLKLAVIGGEEQVCFRTEKKEIEFIIENGINIEIQGLVVDVAGSDEKHHFEFNETMIEKAGTYLGRIPYDPAVDGDFSSLKITPKVFLCNEEPLAINDALVISHLKPCRK